MRITVADFTGSLVATHCDECGRSLEAHTLFDLRVCVKKREAQAERDAMIRKLTPQEPRR